MHNSYNKGSVWRKCDLHAHTPLDHEWINRPSNSQENKKAFAKQFVDHAINEGLEIVAITDHNFCNHLDDLFLSHIIEEASGRPLTILPGFEITVKDGSGIHILVIFKEHTCLKSIHEIVRRLFHFGTELIPSSGIIPISDKDLDELKMILDESTLDYLLVFAHADRENGVLDRETITGTRRVQEWQKPFINICQLSKAKEDFDGEFMKSVINKTNTHYSRDISYIVASDCRTLLREEVEEGRHFLGQKFTWVKCDPTFEGLKQIVYEPFTRVRVQEHKPEPKGPYLTIDKVSFISTDDKFTDLPIELNDKLNAIIGGKSSGKSLLLYYIAKTIDPKQVSQRLEEMGVDEPYEFERDNGFGFQVVWCDGVAYSLNDKQERKRQITYIPQMYINHLAEHKGDKELDRLVQSILNEQEDLRKFFEEKKASIAAAKAQTAAQVIKFFQYKESISEKEAAIKLKGDKDARETNLNNKKEELAQLRAESNFTEEDENAFNEANLGRQISEGRLTRLKMLEAVVQNEYSNVISTIESDSTSSFNSLLTIIQNRFNSDSLLSGILSNMIRRDNSAIENVIETIKHELALQLAQIKQIIKVVEDRISYYSSLLNPYLQKITKKENLNLIQESIRMEENELAQIKVLELEKNGLEGLLRQTKSAINSDYARILEGYRQMAAKVNDEYKTISVEKQIQLKAVIGFNKERFAENCTVHIDKRNYLRETFGQYFDENNHFIFLDEEHLNNLVDFFEKVLGTSIRFNQSGTESVVCERMFDDYFSIHYELYQKAESIFKMSPGKKGLILMYLILHLSNANYPILIDQPEDNLDNRTVYKELKEFLKSKKIDRQILIVTHNANLVVPTDSENVIVANQSGQDMSKDNAQYQFEYVSGALENTFLDENADGILYKMGIREHVCDILEGGEDAFKERELRYSIA